MARRCRTGIVVALWALALWGPALCWTGPVSRRSLLAASVGLCLGVPRQAEAQMEKRVAFPLPKGYRDAVVEAATTLKNALELEEKYAYERPPAEVEKKMTKLEQDSTRLVNGYGMKYVSDKGIPENDPLRSHAVYFYFGQAVGLFKDALKEDSLEVNRKQIIKQLKQALDTVEEVGLAQ
mmetsp:Transcript_46119/g.83003  ORF Transcript_46119/g.83003 Transcript_46119/m.83003 type:complete len:180 (+) Transcript_46119:55-594(+)